MPISELDAIDYNILEVLQKDARISNVELAAKVNLSPSLAFESPLDLKIKGNLLRDTFNLVGVVQPEKRQGFEAACQPRKQAVNERVLE